MDIKAIDWLYIFYRFAFQPQNMRCKKRLISKTFAVKHGNLFIRMWFYRGPEWINDKQSRAEAKCLYIFICKSISGLPRRVEHEFEFNGCLWFVHDYYLTLVAIEDRWGYLPKNLSHTSNRRLQCKRGKSISKLNFCLICIIHFGGR